MTLFYLHNKLSLEKAAAPNTPAIYGQFTTITKTAYTNERLCTHTTYTLYSTTF
jgi:hypothetical protein